MSKAGKTSLVWGIIITVISFGLLLAGIIVRIEYNNSRNNYYYYYYSKNPIQLINTNSNQAR